MRDRVFRDPVHGIIEFSGEDLRLFPIVETRAFQRLRRVHQMGFAWLVYPGAEHSRFGHALGAYHIASRVVQHLQLDERTSLHVRVAALLHDIGHGPFSHAWEQVFPGEDHEAWGGRILAENQELRSCLDSISDGLADGIRAFWSKKYSPSFARKLVSSQLDVDRLDYLLRDGHYSGAGYATYDLDWILHGLRIEEIHSEPDPSDLVIDYRRGMYAVEQYLFARSYMYAQVYHHKTVRAAEWMFVTVLRRFAELAKEHDIHDHLPAVAKLARSQKISCDEYLCLDDHLISACFDSWAGRDAGVIPKTPLVHEDIVLRDLADRFVGRRLFKTIDLGDDPTIIPQLEHEVAKIAQDRFGENSQYYFHFDSTKQVGYTQGEEELHVVGHPRYGTVTLGRLLEDMPLGRASSRIFILCAPELEEQLRPLADKALSRGAMRGRR